MKKSTAWNPAFYDRLEQGARVKNRRLKRKAGYRLYHLYKAKLIKPKKYHNHYSYKITLDSFYGHTAVIDECRWLKPKHLTLLRMKDVNFSRGCDTGLDGAVARSGLDNLEI